MTLKRWKNKKKTEEDNVGKTTKQYLNTLNPEKYKTTWIEHAYVCSRFSIGVDNISWRG